MESGLETDEHKKDILGILWDAGGMMSISSDLWTVNEKWL